MQLDWVIRNKNMHKFINNKIQQRFVYSYQIYLPIIHSNIKFYKIYNRNRKFDIILFKFVEVVRSVHIPQNITKKNIKLFKRF